MAGLCKMRLEVLGCAGGIGGQQRFTTCLLIDHDILLDAGTGIAALGVNQLAAIDHVFLSHSHLDHVAGLALLADAVNGKRKSPITVHATQQVIDALRTHLFNWVLWPDFAAIPNADHPVLRWQPLEPGIALDLAGRQITAHRVNHIAGSVAYAACSTESGFLFTGDMGSTPPLWDVLARDRRLSRVIVDCSFPDAESQLAALSRHFCPRSLLEDIAALPASIEFLIYHLKPGQEDRIMQELNVAGGSRSFHALKCGDVFSF